MSFVGGSFPISKPVNAAEPQCRANRRRSRLFQATIRRVIRFGIPAAEAPPISERGGVHSSGLIRA